MALNAIGYTFLWCCAFHLVKICMESFSISGDAQTAASLLAGGQITAVNLRAIISLTLLIFISSAAYTMSLLPLRYCPVTEVSSWSLLITVFGIIMSALMLGENILRAEYAAAILLIAGGIHLINRRTHNVESI